MADRGRLVRCAGRVLLALLVVASTADAGTKRRCCACLVAWDVRPPSGSRPGMGYFMVSVARSFADMAPLTDPQSWAACGPTNFAASYVTTPAACATAAPTPQPSPPAKGTTWSAPLFESFRAAAAPRPGCNPNETRFRNVLHVEGVRTSTSYRYDYGLCRSIDHRVSCSDGPAGITWDCGFTSLQQDGTGSVLKGVKYLRFADGLGLNAWVQAGMRAMIDDIVDNGVCCGTTGTVDCPVCAPPIHVHVDPPAPLCPSTP